MHVKFLRAGRSGQKAAAYLLRERADEEVIVRRGHPTFFADLVDSLEYKNPYSSAVIAFSPEDQPTEEQIEEVIESFKLTAWAGLDDQDFCILVVEHRKKDGKGTHLHFLIARHHISRGIHYNPAPPGWQKRYDLLRDFLNSKYGWARPDDPKRARKVQPGYLAFPGVGTEKRQVLSWAESMAEMGLGLEEIAEVAQASGAKVGRKGTDYVTLVWGKQRVRVRTPAEKKEKKEVAETIEEQKKKWQKALEKLARENQERYGRKVEKKQGEKKHGRAGERNRNSVTGAGRDCVRGVQARSAAGAESESGLGSLVVLPFASRLGLGRRPGGRAPRKLQRLGRRKIPRIKQGGIGSSGIRIRLAHQESNRTTGNRSRGAGTPPEGIRGLGGAHPGRAGGAAPGAGGAAPAAGSPEPGMAGLWAALEDLFRRLASALGQANTAARTLCAAAYRLVAARGVRGMRGAEQAGQPPAARREGPRADVPRPGWPPGRWQGPGWG